MSQYFHSIRIDTEKCEGRMRCMRACPTQAIRVRNGKATIIEEKCIDCGECITVCPHDAIIPLTDPIGELVKFRHTVALPSPGLHSQFGNEFLKYSQSLSQFILLGCIFCTTGVYLTYSWGV